MTRQEIETELNQLIKRIEKADKYFKNLDLIEVDETREWKLLKSLINRGVQLQDVLNTMEDR